jgi:hypothetical protein
MKADGKNSLSYECYENGYLILFFKFMEKKKIDFKI